MERGNGWLGRKGFHWEVIPQKRAALEREIKKFPAKEKNYPPTETGAINGELVMPLAVRALLYRLVIKEGQIVLTLCDNYIHQEVLFYVILQPPTKEKALLDALR